MEVMDKWVTEFFLRRLQNPRVDATSLFSALKSDDCVKLKITAVLRDMSNSLIRGQMDEGMLDLLEILERLQEDSVIMGSLKSAYCWTAVECTLRFMWPVTASGGFFSEALERILGKRVGILKERESDLVTHELLKWERDLKMAFEEPEMYQKIRETNIRYIAISHINQLLKEQWALLGPSSLESEARKRFLKRKDPNAVRNCDRAGDTIEREGRRNGYSREEVNDVEDKVNEQEQEHEPILNKGDITVARELKDCLLEIQGLVDPSTRQGQETNNASEGTSSSSSRRVRPHLPTPEPLNISPLKKGKPAKTLRRRPMKLWTPEEVKALMEGVKKYGKSWKEIKNSNLHVFTVRTEVDLKDKWRNLIGRQK